MSTIDAVLAERGTRYGVFSGHAGISQSMKAVMHATPAWATLAADQREGLEMIVHKIARILNGNPDYVDSWTDITGYARLVETRLIEKEQLVRTAPAKKRP